ncbi:E3 ubiquitin-protein ligase RNF149-like [Fopius arisanus]|uniref:E3 ubiquitin-protein ligase RNF149-like n=1 Tax=Fopius arisanus TaxID=64838 RepID=A0A9R1U9Q0_9HYME|nr:PREDICTED: E3 ubiquitin-protein ligase RNF149-like [Fopius arisanus]
MTHPGMAFVLVVGVGLATILYYMFADSDNSHNSQNSHRADGGIPPEPPNNSWKPDDRSRYRRKASSTTSELSSCTICLNDITRREIVHINPCRHYFHAYCIREWRDQSEQESHNLCPNCRKKIESLD